MDKFETREAFLLDALDYYTADPANRRCINSSGYCAYSATTINKPTSEGCLIGRNLSEKSALALDRVNDSQGMSIASILVSDKLKAYIPEKMAVLGNGFLWSCQSLHDSNDYWCEKKLTEDGIDKLADIISTYLLDETLFTKYLTYDK